MSSFLQTLLQDPRTIPIAVAVVTGGVVFALRKFAPAWWNKLPPRMQAVPALIVSVLTTAGAETAMHLADLGRELGPMVLEFVTTSFIGWLTAIGGHHTTKRIADGRAKITLTAKVGLLIALPLFCFGCALARTANDARLELCDLLGDQQEAAIKAYARTEGISLTEAFALFRATCLIRAEQTGGDVLAALPRGAGAACQ